MAQKRFPDDYFQNVNQWRDEILILRKILVDAGLTETIKWGGPCYTYNQANVVGLGSFKSYFGLWFYQGVLLPDPKKVLINAQAGKTKALRQWRMFGADDIKIELIGTYVDQAIGLAKAGKSVQPNRTKPLIVPPELTDELAKTPALQIAFDQLKLTNKREFAAYISEAKRPQTKQSRLVKILPLIQAGTGLNDKYK